jgi:hypothetical protein
MLSLLFVDPRKNSENIDDVLSDPNHPCVEERQGGPGNLDYRWWCRTYSPRIFPRSWLREHMIQPIRMSLAFAWHICSDIADQTRTIVPRQRQGRPAQRMRNRQRELQLDPMSTRQVTI